jgi:hypothetical protein
VPTDPVNIFAPSWEEERDGPPGFRARRLYLARTLGSDQLGVSLWEIEPGESNMRTTSTTPTKKSSSSWQVRRHSEPLTASESCDRGTRPSSGQARRISS